MIPAPDAVVRVGAPMAVGLGGAWVGRDEEEERQEEERGMMRGMMWMGWDGMDGGRSKQVRHSAKLEYRHRYR